LKFWIWEIWKVAQKFRFLKFLGVLNSSSQGYSGLQIWDTHNQGRIFHIRRWDFSYGAPRVWGPLSQSRLANPPFYFNSVSLWYFYKIHLFSLILGYVLLSIHPKWPLDNIFFSLFFNQLTLLPWPRLKVAKNSYTIKCISRILIKNNNFLL
jgi:hypothetical protein